MDTKNEVELSMRRFLSKPKISDLEKAEMVYKLLEITPEDAKNAEIRILDEKKDDNPSLQGGGSGLSPRRGDNLILVHYLILTPKVHHIRGIVIDIESEKIVATSFPYTDEISLEDLSEEYLNLDFDDSDPSFQEDSLQESSLQEAQRRDPTFTIAYEGTILRVYRGGETWYMSTHKKIDGRRGRWSGPTFGEMFDDMWGKNRKFEDYLNPKNCNVFLLSHKDNRLVCEIKESKLYHVGTFESEENGGMKRVSGKLLKSHPNVVDQESLKISSFKDLLETANKLDWRECTGLLVTSVSDNKLKCLKILPKKYTEQRDIRGGEPNLRLRYLQLREKGEKEKIRKLYPEKLSFFNDVEKEIDGLTPYLGDIYIRRYRQGNYLRLPQEIYITLEKTRRNYNRKLTLEENIVEHLNTGTARQINAIIRCMRLTAKGIPLKVN